MIWKEQLSEIESHFGYHEQRDWTNDIEFVCNLVERYPNDVEVYIRIIYIIHNILVEEKYPDDKRDEWTDLLQKYFNESYHKFSENAEYLFFISKILYIAEWYFGLFDDEYKLAIKMQKKAMDKEPGNILYEWAYRLSCQGDIVSGYLANQLIEYDKEKVKWLKSKGFPGSYVLEHLQMSNQKYLESNKNK